MLQITKLIKNIRTCSTGEVVRVCTWYAGCLAFFQDFFKINSHANFSITFGPNFRGGGGANCLRGAPCGRKPGCPWSNGSHGTSFPNMSFPIFYLFSF